MQAPAADLDGETVVRSALAVAAPLLAELDHVLGAGHGELSRVARGELDVPGCAPLAIDVLEFCSVAHARTDGGFDAFVEGADGRRHLDPGFPGVALAVDRMASLLHRTTGLSLVVRCGSVAAVRTTPQDPSPFTVRLPGMTDGDTDDAAFVLSDGGAAAAGMRGTAPGGLVAVAARSLPWAAVYAAVLASEGRAGLRRLRPIPRVQAVVRTPSGAMVVLRDGRTSSVPGCTHRSAS